MNEKKNENKVKKIYYIWNYKQWGGAQIYFFGLIRQIKKKAEVTIILPSDSDEQLMNFIKQLDVKYEFLPDSSDISPAPNLKRKLERHWSKLRGELQIIRHLQKTDLDGSILHIELAPWQSLLALSYLCTKARIFMTMHNSLPPASNLRERLWRLKFFLISKFENFYIFPSNEDAKKSLKPFVSERFYEKTKVTYTNVNPEEIEEALLAEIEPDELKSKYNIPDNKFLVFCVGQFIDRKGRWTFLEAARDVFRKDASVAFVWIANSKPGDEDLKKAEEYGLGENFVFITSDQVGKEHIDLFKLMRLADIFALVSFQEGLPISLLEAMALGIASISTNVNAIPEAVRNMETGVLIEAGDAHGLAQAIIELKGSDDLREKLAEKGREFVLENFNEKVVAAIAWKGYQESFK